MIRKRRYDTSEVHSFYETLTKIAAAEGTCFTKLALRLGKSKSFFTQRRKIGRPFSAEVLNMFCCAVEASEETRLRFHKLAVKALGYEV